MCAEKKWNDDWRDELKKVNNGCYIRLCECRNTKTDFKRIAKLMYKYNKAKGAEECLCRTMDWICDWNSQYNLEPTLEEYETILSEMIRKR